jgi:putative flippase GtrA
MPYQFIRFAFAGCVGFLVDAGVLYLMLSLGVNPYVGRILSFFCAAFVTWQINRRITFTQAADKSAWREWHEYLLAMALGGICNYGAYAAALRILPHRTVSPLVAVAVGSIAGMFINFASAKLWVFRGRSGGPL